MELETHTLVEPNHLIFHIVIRCAAPFMDIAALGLLPFVDKDQERWGLTGEEAASGL
jgi:hypothetical protein